MAFTDPGAQMQALQGLLRQTQQERARKAALGTGVSSAIQGWAQQMQEQARYDDQTARADAAEAERKRQFDERMEAARQAQEDERHRYNVEQGQQMILAKAAREREGRAAADQQAAAGWAMRATTPVQGPSQRVSILGGGFDVPGRQQMPTFEAMTTTPNPAGMMGIPGAGPAVMPTGVPRGITPQVALDIADYQRKWREENTPKPQPMPQRNPALEGFAKDAGVPYYPGMTPQDMSRLGGLRPKPETPAKTPEQIEAEAAARRRGWESGAPARETGPDIGDRRMAADNRVKELRGRQKWLEGQRSAINDPNDDRRKAIESELARVDGELKEATRILSEIMRGQNEPAPAWGGDPAGGGASWDTFE